jgi:hypothetical protein
MRVVLAEKELGQITVTASGWLAYTFTGVSEQARPWLEISYPVTENAQGALIIDKIQFQ